MGRGSQDACSPFKEGGGKVGGVGRKLGDGDEGWEGF